MTKTAGMGKQDGFLIFADGTMNPDGRLLTFRGRLGIPMFIGLVIKERLI